MSASEYGVDGGSSSCVTRLTAHRTTCFPSSADMDAAVGTSAGSPGTLLLVALQMDLR